MFHRNQSPKFAHILEIGRRKPISTLQNPKLRPKHLKVLPLQHLATTQTTMNKTTIVGASLVWVLSLWQSYIANANAMNDMRRQDEFYFVREQSTIDKSDSLQNFSE